MLPAAARAPGQNTTDEVAPPVAVTVDDITLGDYSTERVQLNVALRVTAKKDLTIRKISFSGLRANALPLYAAPFKDEITLKAGKEFVLPKPLLVNVYFRDLESLQPLAKMLDDEKTHIAGAALVEVAVGGLARLVVGSQARVPVTFQQEVPVTVPGGAFGKRAALLVIEGADAALQRVSVGAASAAKYFSDWRRELWEQYAPVLVLVRASYTLQGKSADDAAHVESVSVGWRVGNQIVVPREAAAPWKFDALAAMRMKQEGARVRDADLWAWPEDALVAPDAAWKLSGGQLRASATGKEEEDAEFVPVAQGRPVKVAVQKRDASGNVAVFDVADTAAPPVAPKLEDRPVTNEWSSVAVFRFPEGAGTGLQNGLQNKTAHPDLVFVSVKRDGDRLKLQSPVDSSALGSPLIAPEGIIGMVQSETEGVALPAIQKLLKPAAAVR